MLSGMFVRPEEVWTIFSVHWSGIAFRPVAIDHWRKRRWVCFRVAQETVSERQSLDSVTMCLIPLLWLKFLLSQSSRKWTLLIRRYSARNWIMEHLSRRRRAWFPRLRKLSLNRIISNRSRMYPTHLSKQWSFAVKFWFSLNGQQLTQSFTTQICTSRVQATNTSSSGLHKLSIIKLWGCYFCRCSGTTWTFVSNKWSMSKSPGFLPLLAPTLNVPMPKANHSTCTKCGNLSSTAGWPFITSLSRSWTGYVFPRRTKRIVTGCDDLFPALFGLYSLQ